MRKMVWGKTIAAALVLTAALSAGQASGAAKDQIQKQEQSASIEPEFTPTLPPIGYVAFCARGEDECRYQGKVEKLKLTGETWDQINQVNNYVNGSIRPATDVDVYGALEMWAYPVDAGDCEDFALLKKRYLAGLGISPAEMLMTVLLDEKGEGHAVLTITTDQGDLILDNRRPEILRWDQTGYKFLKRQSQQDPRRWVSLQKNTTQVLVGSKAN
jgi:predicted transglutaminase-like cysteine proteinase